MRTRLFPLAAALTLLVAPGLASAQAQSPADVAALVRQEIEAQNRHDLGAVLALLTDDYVQERGTCMDLPGGRCIGKTAYAEQVAHDEGHIRSTLSVLDVQVAGTSATVRAENRFTPNLPPLQAAGIERLIELGRADVRDGKLASLRIVPDLSDAPDGPHLCRAGCAGHSPLARWAVPRQPVRGDAGRLRGRFPHPLGPGPRGRAGPGRPIAGAPEVDAAGNPGYPAQARHGSDADH